MPLLKLDQQAIYYTRQAPREKHRHRRENLPAVILIHGAGGSHLDWPPQLRRIPGAMVYAIDLPGHGRSAGGGRSTIENYASDVYAFITYLGQEQVVLVGHSMGGAIVQIVTLEHPNAINGQILISTGTRLRVREEFRIGIKADFPATVDLLNRYLWADDTPEAIKEFSRETMLAQNPEVTLYDYEACNRFDVTERLAEMTVPTLVICGTHDQMTPLKYNRYLSQNIPGARLEIIEGAGHMVTLEHPLAVSKTIQTFLQEIIPEYTENECDQNSAGN